jgi:Fe2+ transport system protein FeoA
MTTENNGIQLDRRTQGDMLKIVRVTGRGGIKKRLLEMGFIPETLVKIVKYAPLQDPIELVIRGAHTCIRLSEASRIFVTPIGAGSENGKGAES